MKYINFLITAFIDASKYFYLKSSYKFPKVLSMEETLDLINLKKVSFSRFGDGEFNLISKKTIGFQVGNDTLALRLKEVLISNSSSCIICIPSTLNNLNGMTWQSKLIWMHLIGNFYKNYYQYIKTDIQYPNSLITRPYMDLSDKKSSVNLFNKLKQIWENKNIIIVEGENTKLGIGNDLFFNTKSIKRIITVSKNAFSKYDQIFFEAKKCDKNSIFLIALGPTATVLSYDLSQEGFQACDIGHIDIEYEWFLKQTLKKTSISGKQVNELGINLPFENVVDNTYESQIIMRIL
jgi:glycosyltransferase family protein